MSEDKDASLETGLSKSGANVVETANPFANRVGKTLSWSGVNMTLKTKGGERKLLDGVWGEVPNKEITAIMGPSGAGKTSLLNILAGRSRTRGAITVDSNVELNNIKINQNKLSVRKKIAFVAQEESLQITQTPREAIYFSAKLRLPRGTPEKDLNTLSSVMLEELGLLSCSDSFIGGGLMKGISGGEKKRASVGVELVVRPSMVFLDEPTSGLDSFSAVQLVQVLKKVANAGASVLFTIHQPPSEVFNSFDHLILLNKGKVMYEGEVDDIPDFFANCNKPMPGRFNPADWIMQVAQSHPVEELEADGFFPPSKVRVVPNHIVELKTSIMEDEGEGDGMHVGFLTQASMLFKREFLNIRRDKASIGARLGITIFIAVLTGSIFYGVGKTDSKIDKNIQSHFGALVIITLNAMFGTAQPTLLAFPTERPVFLREYSTNHYSVGAYFLSKFFTEVVVTAVQILALCGISYVMVGFQMNFLIFYAGVLGLAMTSTAFAVLLGCATEDPALGQELLPLLFVPQMLFAGFFVASDLIPVWLRWCQYLCSLTYSLRIILQGEFGICKPEAQSKCDRLLESVGVDEDDVWWYWLTLGSIFVVCRLFALRILQSKATKFF